VHSTFPAHDILLDFIILMIYAAECRLQSFLLCSVLHSPVTSSLLVQVFSSASCSQTPSTCEPPKLRFLEPFPDWSGWYSGNSVYMYSDVTHFDFRSGCQLFRVLFSVSRRMLVLPWNRPLSLHQKFIFSRHSWSSLSFRRYIKSAFERESLNSQELATFPELFAEL
jgi:hypothetical protein